MGQVYVSIKPFKNSKGLEYADNFIDVTEHLTERGLSNIRAQLDNTEFDIGIFRHANFNVEFNNTDGLFSKASGLSIFNFQRNDSIVRVQWERNSEAKPLGFHPCGDQYLSPLYHVGDFLLADLPAKGSSIDQAIKFKCLGYSTIFERVLAPYDLISNGDLLSEVIYKCLNQAKLTGLMNITQANIVCGNDVTIDDKTLGDIENKTVLEVLKKILPFSNSILKIQNASDPTDATSLPTVLVSGRTESATNVFTFRGPGSIVGIENIIKIENDNPGENKVINFVSVPDTAFSASSTESISNHGYRKKEIEFAPVTDQTKNESACQAVVDEFNLAKREFDVLTPMDYPVLALELLDKVNFDYPIRVLAEYKLSLPIFDVAVFGDRFGYEIIDIKIAPSTRFKIMAVDLDLKKEIIKFSVREVGEE